MNCCFLFAVFFSLIGKNKHAVRKNKTNIIEREFRVIINVLIEYQMEKQNKK
jgi:hypothetical protein